MRKTGFSALYVVALFAISTCVGCYEAAPPDTKAPETKKPRGMTIPGEDGKKPATDAPAATPTP